MNIYEVNKGLYLNVPPMEEEPIKKVILDFLQGHESCYYLMLNHDIHYYTMFHANTFNIDEKTFVLVIDKMVDEIYSIIADLGPVVDIINNQETAMLEIWIKYDGDPMMFGLFDYTRGVVEVE